MKKKLITVVVGLILGFSLLHPFAWAADGDTWQERVDNWFIGLGQKLDQAGDKFTKVFLTWQNPDR